MKAIVTGATGFLGGHLVKSLDEQGHQVIAMGRNREAGLKLVSPNVSFAEVDLRHKRDTSNALENADVIFHCAALSSAWGSYEDFYQSNVIATKNLMDAAVHHKIKRFIYVSSTSVYFDFKNRFGISEDQPLPKKFANHYAVTKYLGEKVVQEQGCSIETVIIRPRGIIGEGDTAIMPRILRTADKGVFPLFDQGSAMVDVTYVKNLVDALILSAKTPSINGEIFNISNDEPISVKSLLNTTFTRLNKTVRFINLPYSLIFTATGFMEWVHSTLGLKEPPLTRYSLGLLACSQTLNIDKAKTLLGYQPTYSIKQSIDCYSRWKNEL